MSLSTSTDNLGAKSREAVNQVALDAILSANPLGKFMKTLLLWLASLFSLPVEMLLRRNFGERYLPFSAVTLSAVVYAALAWLNRGGRDSGFSSGVSLLPGAGLLTWLFFFAFVGAGIYHRVVIFRRNWYSPSGTQWHSYAAGDSWLQPFTTGLRGNLPFMVPVTEATQRYIEPYGVVILGFILLGIDGFLGFWLILAGFSLSIKEQLKYTTIRNNYLNMVDSQLEAQATTDLLKRGWSDLTPDTNTQPADKVRRNGYTAYIPIPTRTPEQREAAIETLEGMFPREMQAAREGASGSRWQQAKARQQSGNAAENSSTAPGTGDD